MDIDRKDTNIQIGKRLREARTNMNIGKSEFAEVLEVTEEHYRKLEAGMTGLSVDKILVLYHTYKQPVPEPAHTDSSPDSYHLIL